MCHSLRVDYEKGKISKNEPSKVLAVFREKKTGKGRSGQFVGGQTCSGIVE